MDERLAIYDIYRRRYVELLTSGMTSEDRLLGLDLVDAQESIFSTRNDQLALSKVEIDEAN